MTPFTAPPELVGLFRSADGFARYAGYYQQSLGRWPVPVEGRSVPTPIGPARVNVCGPADAPPLVLLHGMGFSSTMWGPNVAAWAATRRVYAPDVAGQPGLSAAAPRPRTAADLLTWLAAVLDGLGLGRVDLVGQSYGGWLALRFALRFPHRGRRLGLLAPAASFRPINPQFHLRGAIVTLLPNKRTVTWFMRWVSARPPGPVDQIAEPVVRQFGSSLVQFVPRLVPIPDVLTDRELRAVRCPTLVLVGRREVIYPATAAVRRAAATMPDVRAEVLPDTGHGLTFDATDRVNEKVGRFLDGG